MTNTVPAGSSGAPSYTSSPTMYRRLSYAAVAGGNASANQPTRSGAFSHLVNSNQPPNNGYSPHNPMTHSRHPSRNADIDGHQNSMGTSWGKGAQLPSYSSQFGNGAAFGGAGPDPSASPFFIPSYLQGSRHAQRLEELHKAKLKAQRGTRSTHSSNPGSLSTSSSSVNLHKMVPSHRGMTHDIIERIPVHQEEPGALPTGWSDHDKASGLDVMSNGLEVRYAGLSKTQDEAASIRADHPMPRQCGIYYYEVTIVSKGKEGLVGVGFSSNKVPLNRLPGWEQESWAYHGDDGMSFCCTSSGKHYGPKFSTLDVIGCGVNFRTGCAFFTKNGVNLGIAFKDIKSDRLYPSIGMKKPGEHVRVNFGQTPFVFDIDSMVQQEKLFIQDEINRTSVTSLHPPLDETALIHELIAQYLTHDGYVETARAFAQEVREESRALANGTPSHLNDEDDLDAINRQYIRQAILDGDIDKALKHTKAYYPDVLQNNENIYFKLKCRKFIEMIRKCNELKFRPQEKQGNAANGHAQTDDYGVFDHEMELDDQVESNDWENMDTDENILMKYNNLTQEIFQYGKELQTEFNTDPRREVNKALKDTFALLAYEDARQSPLAHMLEVGERVPVAEELNSAILVSLGKSSSAALERLCQQTEALVNELSEDGGAGAFINVPKDFLQ